MPHTTVWRYLKLWIIQCNNKQSLWRPYNVHQWQRGDRIGASQDKTRCGRGCSPEQQIPEICRKGRESQDHPGGRSHFQGIHGVHRHIRLPDVSEKLIGITRRCRSEHPGCKIHFNIIAGTNVVGCAMCTVAMWFSGTDVYYLKYRKLETVSKYDEVIQVELTDNRSLDTLLRSGKTAEALRLFSETDSLEHHKLLERSGLKPSTLAYHTKRLMKMEPLDRRGPGTKVPVWTVFDKGRAVLDRLTLIDGRRPSLTPSSRTIKHPYRRLDDVREHPDEFIVEVSLLTARPWILSITCKRTSFAIYVDLWSVSFTIYVFSTRWLLK